MAVLDRSACGTMRDVKQFLRQKLKWAAVAVAIALSALSARAEEPRPLPEAQGPATQSSNEAAGVAMMGPAQASIDRGLAYLVTRQQEDGSLSTGGYGRNAAVVATFRHGVVGERQHTGTRTVWATGQPSD